MAGKHVRGVDPANSVTRALDARRGFTSQADVRETKHAVERLDAVGDKPNEIDGNLSVSGDINWDGDGVARWLTGLSYEVKQLVIRGIESTVEQDFFRFWSSGGAAGFEATNLYNGVDQYFIFQSSTTFNSPYVLMRGPGVFYFRNNADVDTASIDPETGNITTTGLITGSNDRWQSGAHHDPGATTLSVVGMTAWTVPATVTSADDAAGSWLTSTTGAVSGNTSGPNGPAVFRPDWGIDATFRIKTSGTTTTRWWIGLCASDPSGSAVPGTDQMAFRYDTGAGDTGWSVRTRSATGSTLSTNVTTVPLNNTAYTLRIVASSTSVAYYIDGVLVQTHSTAANIPATTLLAPYVRVTTLSAITRAILLGYFNALSQ